MAAACFCPGLFLRMLCITDTLAVHHPARAPTLPPYCSPCSRAGRDPQGDAARHTLHGTPAVGVTGEAVVVRQAPDLEALRKDLQVWRPPLLLALYSYQFYSVDGEVC